MDGLNSWDMVYVTQHELAPRLLAAAVMGGLISLGLIERWTRRTFGDD